MCVPFRRTSFVVSNILWFFFLLCLPLSLYLAFSLWLASIRPICLLFLFTWRAHEWQHFGRSDTQKQLGKAHFSLSQHEVHAQNTQIEKTKNEVRNVNRQARERETESTPTAPLPKSK